MVARVVWDHQAAGSSPVASTIDRTRKNGLNAYFFGFLLCSIFAVWCLFGVYCREKIPKDTKRNERASVGKPRRPLAVFYWLGMYSSGEST